MRALLRPGLQFRIALGYAALAAVLLLGLGIFLVNYTRADELKTLETQMRAQALWAAEAAHYQLADTSDTAAAATLATETAAALNARVTLVRPDGTVWADSVENPADMPNLRASPEIQAALDMAGSISAAAESDRVDEQTLYAAVPILGPGGEVRGVARIAMALAPLDEEALNVITALLGAMLAALLLTLPLAVIVARLTVRQLALLTGAAQRLAAGDLDVRVPVAGHDEVGVLARAFDNMAERLRTHVQALDAQRRHLSAVLSNLATGVLLVDSVGREILLANPAAGRILHRGTLELEGWPVASVDGSALAEVVDEALASTNRPAVHLVELAMSGGKAIAQITASRVPGTAPASDEVVVALEDVTALQAAETARRAFIANVSHDLRTPIAGLRVLVEALDEGALEDPVATRDFLQRMRIEVDGLSTMVEELLELSRLEGASAPLRMSAMCPADVARSAAERLRPLAERSGVVLRIELPDGLPHVRGDADRIMHVVVNLVHNAIKFTPPGGEVRVGGEVVDRDVRIWVADTGEGISAKALPRLFERFYKVDRARARGGTGLGLAIAREIVVAHGGRIWATSPGDGQGTTVTFTLPLPNDVAS